MTNPLSDRELLQLLQKRQASALKQIYDYYGDMMYSLAFRILHDRQEAEDLLQDIFLNLWTKCTYNPDRGSLKTFLLLLVRSRAVDRLRSQKSNSNTLENYQKGVEIDNLPHSPLQDALSDEIAVAVRAAIAELPEKQRQALEMAYYQGLSQTEISQRLDAPVGTVKSWFRLGFSKLRNSLQHFLN